MANSSIPRRLLYRQRTYPHRPFLSRNRPWSGGHAHARTLNSTKVTKYFDYFATPCALFDHTGKKKNMAGNSGRKRTWDGAVLTNCDADFSTPLGKSQSEWNQFSMTVEFAIAFITAGPTMSGLSSTGLDTAIISTFIGSQS